MFIATLIAKDRLSSGDISAAEDALRDAGVETDGRSWLDEDKACDLLVPLEPSKARELLEAFLPACDVVVQGESARRRKLLIADMDSTMITVECIDELADYAGIKDRVAEVTERAMRGELAFEGALRERVALLKDMDEAMLDRCHAERVKIMAGARALVRTMRREGGHAVLVSGGFTRFADRVAAEIGFDRAIANTLEIGNGKLLGTVAEPIVGADTKRKTLVETAAALGISTDFALAVGDGANDIPMLEAAGLGVAYHAKPKTAAAADARIEHNDLTALLYAQGYSRREWEADA
jgi:phosphoserine phosphatase